MVKSVNMIRLSEIVILYSQVYLRPVGICSMLLASVSGHTHLGKCGRVAAGDNDLTHCGIKCMHYTSIVVTFFQHGQKSVYM